MYEKRNQQLANQQTHTKRFNDYQIAYLREIHGVRILSYDDGNTITGTPDNHVVWSTKYWEDMVIEHGYLNNEYKETKRIKERRKPIIIDQYNLHVNPQTHRFGAPLPRQRTNVLDTSSNTNSSVNRGITLTTLRRNQTTVLDTPSNTDSSVNRGIYITNIATIKFECNRYIIDAIKFDFTSQSNECEFTKTFE
eukprot:669790_1